MREEKKYEIKKQNEPMCEIRKEGRKEEGKAGGK